MPKGSWKDYVLDLFANYLSPLEAAYDPHGWTAVIDTNFRLPLKFRSSGYAFTLQASREASHWLMVLELSNPYFIPSDAGKFPVTVTGETLEETFQQLNQAMADEFLLQEGLG